MSTFTKAMSATDRYFAAYNEVRPPFVIQLALAGEGDPDPEALHDALAAATAVNPGCALRADESGAEPRWVLGPPPTLTVVDAPTWTGDRNGPDAPFLLWPLDSFTGPTTELVYVRGAGQNFLVFRALHAVMDGQGTLAWVKDVLRALRGEAPLGHPSTLTTDELLEGLQTEKRPAPDPDALHPFGRAREGGRGEFLWRRVTVPRPLHPGATGRIAVGLAERARRFGAGKVRINLPTDLRPYRPAERTTGNLFNALFIEVPEGAAPESIGLKVMQMLYKKEGQKKVGVYAGEGAPASIAIHRVKILWDMAHLHDTGRYAFSATLSHLGQLRSAELSAPTFRTTGAYFIPLVGDSGCVLSVNGFDDRTESCVGLSDRFGGDPEIEALADLVREALGGA